jgi:hypothetical protein
VTSKNDKYCCLFMSVILNFYYIHFKRGADSQKILTNMLKILQNTVNYCNLLKFTVNTAKYCKILQNNAKYCNTTQNYCKISEDTAKYWKIFQNTTKFQEMQNIFFLNSMFLVDNNANFDPNTLLNGWNTKSTK